MTIVNCAVYEHGERKLGEVPPAEAHEFARRMDDSFVWIGLHEPTEQEFESVTSEFDLPHLAVEDALKAHQRPKLEVYGDMLFAVLKTARYVDPEEVIQVGEIMLFVGAGFVITVRHGEGSALKTVRARLEREPKLLQLGPGGVAYAVVDKVVDDYEPVVAGVDQDIDQVEEQVFTPGKGNPTERIYKLKREVLEFHRAVAPLKDPLDKLARGHFDAVPDTLHDHFRDVYDHVLRVDSAVEGFRDLLTSVLEANLTQVQTRQNEDMRKITAWVAIAAVPTAVAAIYGMNFKHMPELNQEWGYPAVLGFMLIVCLVLHRQFRRSGWL